MVFSSITFLFLFLPVLLACYFLAPKFLRNTVLLVFSLLFYFWGSPEYFYLIIVAILGNYFLGLCVHQANARGKWRGAALLASIIFNFGLLFYYKYFNFFMDSVNSVRLELNYRPLPYTTVALPIGISFFIFQGASYIFDLYRNVVPVQKNPFKFALYKALFPQLIAGPIVRYVDVYKEIDDREVSPALFLQGISRFIIGLGKKVIIANGLAGVADRIFALPASELTVGLSWLGVIAYSFQIYFDFSGYSDMAIGMGRMFGFHFLENFNYPYISRSITEFWRRWHISLSSWFRDYLYIPLGGNRHAAWRTYLNLYIVFTLCGIWHGAAWNFLVWGLFHGTLLVLERLFLGNWLQRMPGFLAHLLTLFFVLIGWVLFRADSFGHAFTYIGSMFAFGSKPLAGNTFLELFNSETIFLLILAGLASTPWLRMTLFGLREARRCGAEQDSADQKRTPLIIGLAQVAMHFAILFYACILLSAGAYNPFIYFRF